MRNAIIYILKCFSAWGSVVLLNVEQVGGYCSLDLTLDTMAIDETWVSEYKYVINSTKTEESESMFVPVGSASMDHSTQMSCSTIEVTSHGVDSSHNDVTQASDTKMLNTGKPSFSFTLVRVRLLQVSHNR